MATRAEKIKKLREILKEGGPVTIPIPGLKDDFGSGDLIEKLTKSVGIKPCSSCQKRKEFLNRRLRFAKRYKTVPASELLD